MTADQGEAGEGWSDEKITKALDTNVAMVERVRAKRVVEGLDAVLIRKNRETPPVPAIFDGAKQAQLVALACSPPPPDFARWTIPDAATLKREVGAWRTYRNTHNAKADWHFTTADARIKLKSLYPTL